MTGVLCAIAGSGSGGYSATMTVGTTTVSAKATIYYTGFIDPDSTAANLPGFIGALVPDAYKDCLILALYWQSTTGFGGTGTAYIEVSGNRSSGYVGQIAVNGVNLGSTPTSPTYYSGTNSTVFTVSSSVANPFGTSGTRTITVAQ